MPKSWMLPWGIVVHSLKMFVILFGCVVFFFYSHLILTGPLDLRWQKRYYPYTSTCIQFSSDLIEFCNLQFPTMISDRCCEEGSHPCLSMSMIAKANFPLALLFYCFILHLPVACGYSSSYSALGSQFLVMKSKIKFSVALVAYVCCAFC